MFIRKLSIHRRTFLRGVGATLALPLLDAMVPAFSTTVGAAASQVRRLGFVYVPNGVNVGTWNPPGEGSGIPELLTAFDLSL